MSILIRGMEMPTSCCECPFLDYEQGYCLASAVKIESVWFEPVLCPGGIKDGRHADCPLVPVPPHGDLIDRDALMKGEGRYIISFGKEGIDVAEINRAPTIIPAEEGE